MYMRNVMRNYVLLHEKLQIKLNLNHNEYKNTSYTNHGKVNSIQLA